MDVTTMRLTSNILKNASEQFSSLSFVASDEFRWSPSKNTIFYNVDDPLGQERLLHELSHAELRHTSYDRDITLISMERDAWRHAKTILGPMFAITISSDIIEDDLDTYRDWLHARSTCPHCQSTGIQTEHKEYTCVACQKRWTVNTAMKHALRRYKKTAS